MKPTIVLLQALVYHDHFTLTDDIGVVPVVTRNVSQ
jgi:hypothetical protein